MYVFFAKSWTVYSNIQKGVLKDLSKSPDFADRTSPCLINYHNKVIFRVGGLKSKSVTMYNPINDSWA